MITISVTGFVFFLILALLLGVVVGAWITWW